MLRAECAVDSSYQVCGGGNTSARAITGMHVLPENGVETEARLG